MRTGTSTCSATGNIPDAYLELRVARDALRSKGADRIDIAGGVGIIGSYAVHELGGTVPATAEFIYGECYCPKLEDLEEDLVKNDREKLVEGEKSKALLRLDPRAGNAARGSDRRSRREAATAAGSEPVVRLQRVPQSVEEPIHAHADEHAVRRPWRRQRFWRYRHWHRRHRRKRARPRRPENENESEKGSGEQGGGGEEERKVDERPECCFPVRTPIRSIRLADQSTARLATRPCTSATRT